MVRLMRGLLKLRHYHEARKKKTVVCAQLCQILSPGHLEIEDWWLFVPTILGSHNLCEFQKVTWKSFIIFILSHDFHQALVDAFVPLVLESQTRLAPMSLCPLEIAFGQVPQKSSNHHLDFVLLGDLCKHLHLRPLLGGGEPTPCMPWPWHEFFLCFFLGAILGLWIFVNLWSSFLFLILVWIQDNVTMVFHAWRLANSTKGTRTAFWSRMICLKHDELEKNTSWNVLSQGNLIGAFSYFGSGSEDFYVELLTTVTNRTSRLQPISVQHILTALCRLQGRVAGEKLQGPLDMLCEAWHQL